MRIVVQRVDRASVRVGGETASAIGRGLLLLVGVEKKDGADTARAAAEKIAHMRVFPMKRGEDERMDRSALEEKADVMVVSQFTLAGSLRKGRRPGFDNAAPPEQAEPIYLALAEALRALGLRVETGVFRAMMSVELVNDGPVTFILEPEA